MAQRVKGGGSLRVSFPTATREFDSEQLSKFVARALMYGRAELMRWRGLAVILMSMKMKMVPGLNTYATNGKHIFYDPYYIVQRYKSQQVAADLAHECLHKMFGHHIRVDFSKYSAQERDKLNYVMDLAINAVLKDLGFDVDETFVYEEKYHGWSFERIWRDLPDNWMPPQPPQVHLYMPPVEGDEGERDSNGQTESDKTPITQEELEALGEDLATVLHTAFDQNDGFGLKSAQLQELVKSLERNQVKWEEELIHEAMGTVPFDYTMRTPNRRYLHYDLYMPRFVKHGIGVIYIWPDSSGSMDAHELQACATEINYIVTRLHPERVEVLHCDARLHHVETFYAGQTLEGINFKGRGGTDPGPALEYVIEQGDAHMFIGMTDLHFNHDQPDPGCPSIWLSVSDRKDVPFGKLITVDVKDYKDAA